MPQTFDQAGPVNGKRLIRASHELGDDVIAGYLAELDDARARISHFADLDPDEVLTSISAIAGRLAEIRANLHRDDGPRAQRLRTREVDPLRDDLELHFKVWSRKIALMEWELKLSGGAP